MMMCWLRARGGVGLRVFCKHKQYVRGVAIQEYKKRVKRKRERDKGANQKQRKVRHYES